MNDSVREAIGQKAPFRSRAQEAVVALLRTADEVRRTFELLVRPYGLTFQQYNVLRILRGAEPSGLPTLEIGDRMLQRTPGVTRLVDRLVGKGLVSRERDPEDRRRVICRPTDDGLELLEEIDPEMDEADDRAPGPLDDDELDDLVEMLDRIRVHHEDRRETNG